MEDLKTQLIGTATKHLVGKTVHSVRFLTDKERELMMWNASSCVITFSDGTMLFSSSDEEMNDSGVIQIIKNYNQITIPRL